MLDDFKKLKFSYYNKISSFYCFSDSEDENED